MKRFSRVRTASRMMRRAGLVAGPLLAALLYLWIPEGLQDPAGGELQLGTAGRMTGALAGWMAIWWMTEAIPIFVTALLPAIVRVRVLDRWHGNADWNRHQQGVPPVLVVVFAVVLMTFLTELTSNLASTATLVPVFAAMAGGMGIDPLAITIPTALAASCAFMLPAATPPNSIVFGSGMLRIPDMVRAGIWINTLGIVVISLLAYPLVGMLF